MRESSGCVCAPGAALSLLDVDVGFAVKAGGGIEDNRFVEKEVVWDSEFEAEFRKVDVVVEEGDSERGGATLWSVAG